MSFFGQQNNQQQPSTGFGGFGSSNTASTGFGQQPAQNNGGASLFGNNSTNTSGSGFGGFGSGVGTSGFGSTQNNSSSFGQNRPAFGASTSTGGGLFGGGTATTGNSGGFGGFGSTTNNNNNNSNAGGGLFGSTPKPAFGAASTGGGLFGGGNTTGGFGQTNTQNTSAFGTSSALGQNVGECQGTGSTPFIAFTEKEGTGNTTNHYQSISFMAPYKNFSFEELRLADYNQGRRFGNASGQAGAFGSTNFGGFGQQNNSSGFGQTNNSAGLFGQPAASSAPFGTSQPAQSGFGSTAGGSLFGQKPATAQSNLFGQATSSQQSGGLFASAGNTGGGFGSTNTGGFGGSGGLFGTNNNNNQQNQQSKPPFSFGATTTTSSGGFGSTSGGFGASNTNNTSGNLFGQQNQNNNPFGQQQQPNQSSGLFGSAFGGQNQNQNQNQATGGGFGFGQQNQEQKPAGLFGTAQPTNAGTGLFGNAGQNNQQNTGTGLFGNQPNNQPSGNSLFGNKPQTTGTSLFGTNTATNNTNNSTGLFGSAFGGNNANQNQQNQGSGLFANANNQQKPGGLFGTQNSNAGGLFGTTNNQSTSGGGLFGASNQQPQQQTNSLFGSTNNNAGSSLFGNTQQQPQQQNAFQTSQAYSTSLLDPNAFGSPSIFGGLPPPPQVTGPIATPISSKKTVKKGAVIPHYKLNPNGSSRFQTPQRRGGFGFSYSTYGTPGSASSNASTPGGFSSSSLYSSIGRGLGKSLSTSNLRRNFDDAESVLTPGAFSAGSSRLSGSSNLKRLTIDRSLRTDLFSNGKETPPLLTSPEKEKQPSILKKKVSFDANTVGGNGEPQSSSQANGNGGNKSNTQSPEEPGFLRSPRTPAKEKQNGATTQPEMEQIRGNELAIVHEDASPEASGGTNGITPATAPRSQEDQVPGQYWMKPSKDDLVKLSKDERTRVSGFSVGREGCGHVQFDKPVDLTLTKDLDDIFDNIVEIGLRSITVYPDQSKKPAQGKGLNVPSTLYLENSWPRQKDRKTPLHEKSGPRFNRHVDRLRKVGGTEFVRYEKETGTWVFKVPHFTTYGFEYDDDASAASEVEVMNSSVLSEPPDTPTPKSRAARRGQKSPATTLAQQSTTTIISQQSFASTESDSHISSSPDDTFQFRKKKYVPGTFDEDELPDDDEVGEDQEMEEVIDQPESFLDGRLAVSPSDSGDDEPSDVQDAVNKAQERSIVVRDGEEDTDMEMAGTFPLIDLDSQLALVNGTPGKAAFNVTGDWAEALQRTISPKRQDRAALRKKQSQLLGDQHSIEETPTAKKSSTKSIKTHGDLMNSLFGKEQTKKAQRQVGGLESGKSLKWPYSRKNKLHEDTQNMPEQVRLLHDNYKPHWGPNSTLLYSTNIQMAGARRSRSKQGNSRRQAGGPVSEGRGILFTRFDTSANLTPETLTLQRANTSINLQKGVPMAHPQKKPFKDIAESVQPSSTYEKHVWTLASILFDDQDTSVLNTNDKELSKYEPRLRKDNLIGFWSGLSTRSANNSLASVDNHEERAVIHLSSHDIPSACAELIQAKDFRLSMLIAQLVDRDETVRDDMNAQLNAWRELNVLSEMTEPIRALYALLAGQTCTCQGQKGPLEDRARDFVISERFKMDWRRAFGLRLYYAALAHEPIEVAVNAFAKDLEDGSEVAKPTRTLVRSNGTTDQLGEGEDLLWSLLKLYAASKDWLPLPSIAHILNQQDVTADNKLNVVLSFQLYHALTIRFPNISNPPAADSLAVEFSTQLEGVDEWVWAMFATLHITSAPQRQQGLQDLLAHHAHEFHAEPTDTTFLILTRDFKIPEPWIWQAKALAARSITGDHVREVDCLVHACDWAEAHTVLRRKVGPRCVITEDWPLLARLLDRFQHGKENIPDWSLGGQVFEDFLSIVAPLTTTAQIGGLRGKREALGRLMDALPDLVDKSKLRVGFLARVGDVGRTKGPGSAAGDTNTGGDVATREGFEEMVALREMSDVVAKEVMASRDNTKGKDKDTEDEDGDSIDPSSSSSLSPSASLAQEARVLSLPLTRNAQLKHARELSERYYRGLMAGV